MRSITYTLSSPRTRGPFLRVLAMSHSKQTFEAPVAMDPRLRGDDTESVGRAFILYTEAFLPKK